MVAIPSWLNPPDYMRAITGGVESGLGAGRLALESSSLGNQAGEAAKRLQLAYDELAQRQMEAAANRAAQAQQTAAHAALAKAEQDALGAYRQGETLHRNALEEEANRRMDAQDRRAADELDFRRTQASKTKPSNFVWDDDAQAFVDETGQARPSFPPRALTTPKLHKSAKIGDHTISGPADMVDAALAADQAKTDADAKAKADAEAEKPGLWDRITGLFGGQTDAPSGGTVVPSGGTGAAEALYNPYMPGGQGQPTSQFVQPKSPTRQFTDKNGTWNYYGNSDNPAEDKTPGAWELVNPTQE